MDIIERLSDRRRVYEGLVIQIDHLTATLPNGKRAPREVAVHPGASAVVPVDDAGNVYLVRQFRAPLEKVTLEIPAGKLDAPGEDRQKAAERELKEETGLSAGNWQKLIDLATTPGFCDEVISIYLATALTAGKARPDEDEFVSLVKLPLHEAIDLAARGEIEDSKTVCGLLLAERVLCKK
ncbi:MAG: NUDIX hydrolase [Christensenellales bacterium]|jgi:ADP-ribose pyrophosphatase